MEYTKGNEVQLSGFTYADWDGSTVDQKITSGYCFSLGSGMTSWCSGKQKSIALSSAEAEYMAASTASCETIWLCKLLLNLLKKRMEPTEIMCDNQSCIKLSENPMCHDRSKHIDIWCHFIRDYVQWGDVQLRYTPTEEQVANILTKALSKIKFTYFREKMGMVENSPVKERMVYRDKGSYSMDEVVAETVPQVAARTLGAQQVL